MGIKEDQKTEIACEIMALAAAIRDLDARIGKITISASSDGKRYGKVVDEMARARLGLIHAAVALRGDLKGSE